MMSKKKFFIFDIDGTLINTFDMYMPALFATLADHGYQFNAQQLRELPQRMYGLAAENALRELGVKESALQGIQREWIRRAYHHLDAVTVFPAVAQALGKLHANRQNRLAIVTSKTRQEYQRYFYPRYDFAKYFSVVVTADDTEKHKPDPAPLLKAMDLLGADVTETVYVGDMRTDMEAAHAAGIRFAGANYGTIAPANLRGADYLLQTPLDLMGLK